MQVSVEKDAGSDIPDIDMKKLVSNSITLGYLDLYCKNGIGFDPLI